MNNLNIPGIPFNAEYNVKLAPYTTWKIGGFARMLIMPESIDELLDITHYVKKKSLSLFIIGNGSNVLIDDDGLDGVVLVFRNTFNHIFLIDGEYIKTGSGCLLPKLASIARENGLKGFEFLIGIPGSVGGGIACNAGLGGRNGLSMKDVLVEAKVLSLEDNSIITVSGKDLKFSYRYSALSEKKMIVIEALFKGIKDDSSNIKKREAKILAKRKKKQPFNCYAAGSVFKQPVNGHPAGWYIENVGLKGHTIGDAVVSTKHANWIINKGRATSTDIKSIIQHIQFIVLQNYGVSLEREVCFFPEDANMSNWKGLIHE